MQQSAPGVCVEPEDVVSTAEGMVINVCLRDAVEAESTAYGPFGLFVKSLARVGILIDADMVMYKKGWHALSLVQASWPE
eukprot:8291415-Alexandrium_andersonii.AAC.1